MKKSNFAELMMDKLVKLFAVIIVLFDSTVASGQQDQGGFLAPGDSLSKIIPEKHLIFLPEDGFTFYTSPAGDFKGKIMPGPPLEMRGDPEIDTLLVATLAGNQMNTKLLPADFFFETSDSCYYLSYNQQREDHFLVDNGQFQGWLSIEEVRKKGFKPVSWMQFYGESKGRMIHSREKTVAIRSAADDNAPVVNTADELYSEITSTGKCLNLYCQVKIVEYKNPYDPSKSKEENVLKKYKGWIKIIDDDGRPLVAHNR